MGVVETLRCPACGHDRKPAAFGLAPAGEFDAASAGPNELSLRRTYLRGRANITVERVACPVPQALGIRQMLKHRLAQVEEELRAAGVELDDE